MCIIKWSVHVSTTWIFNGISCLTNCCQIYANYYLHLPIHNAHIERPTKKERAQSSLRVSFGFFFLPVVLPYKLNCNSFVYARHMTKCIFRLNVVVAWASMSVTLESHSYWFFRTTFDTDVWKNISFVRWTSSENKRTIIAFGWEFKGLANTQQHPLADQTSNGNYCGKLFNLSLASLQEHPLLLLEQLSYNDKIVQHKPQLRN